MKSGRVGLIGRPNAGKSTLLNRLVQVPIAAVSDKPQTTRHRLVGLVTDPTGQMVLIDTPGVHKPMHRMNEEMVKTALAASRDVDVLCVVTDAASSFGRGDEYLLALMEKVDVPKVLLLNKVDSVAKPKLLPLIGRYASTELFEQIVPISARTGDGVDSLMEILWSMLPEGEPLYDPELMTLQTERYLAAEKVREKVLRRTRDELPFATAVLIEEWTVRENGQVYVRASIVVERPGQRRIVIGDKGSVIKAIGIEARRDLEEMLDQPIYLDLHVRCVPGWRDRPELLNQLEAESRSVV